MVFFSYGPEIYKKITDDATINGIFHANKRSKLYMMPYFFTSESAYEISYTSTLPLLIYLIRVYQISFQELFSKKKFRVYYSLDGNYNVAEFREKMVEMSPAAMIIARWPP